MVVGMHRRTWLWHAVPLLALAASASASIKVNAYTSSNDQLFGLQQDQGQGQGQEQAGDLFSAYYNDRPADCPPCFNCNLDDFVCHQFANCTQSSGKCACPHGFGGEDCSEPLCGSLADGNNRLPRQGHECACKDGWEGINCNVCKTDLACNAMMPEGSDGVCFREGVVVKENHQICDITNRKILDQLKEKKPQATFSCNAEREECNFQCECCCCQPSKHCIRAGAFC